ncbi:MAG: DUF5702 domain-containing protein [Blautia sp.]
MGSKSIIMGAGDMAMNATLTNYDSDLKDIYGMFGLEDILSSADLEKYFINTLNAATIDGGSGYGGFIQLDSNGCSISGVAGSEVCQPEVMFQQLLEYSKYRAPLSFGEDLMEKLNLLKEKKKTAKAVQKQLEVSGKIGELINYCEQLEEQLESHNQYCAQNPTDQQVNDTVAECYKTVGKMLVISYAISHAQFDQCTQDTEYLVSSFLQAVENVSVTSGDPAAYFGSIMAAMEYQQTIVNRDLDEMVDSAATDEERDRLQALKDDYNTKQLLIDRYRERVNAVARNNISTAYDHLLQYKRIADGAVSTAQACLATLNNMISLIDDGIQPSMEEWHDIIETLSSPDKEVQQRQYDVCEAAINKDSINDIMGCLNDNTAYFNKLNEYLRGYKFDSIILIDNPSATIATFNESSDLGYRGTIYSQREAENQGIEYFNLKYTKGNYDLVTGMMYHNLNEHPYFQELSQIIQESQSSQVEGNIDANKGQANQGMDEANSEVTGLQNADWSGNIPSVWLGQNAASGVDSGVSNVDIDNEDYGELNSSGASTLDAVSSALEGLEEALATGLEDLIIMEYGIQMFSYYTIDKNTDGSAVDPNDIVSLSGFKFCNESTAMYKSEVEYLLWGNRDANINVRNTKMLLFGIRFLLNCAYAFTSPSLTQQAASIAAASTFAAPVVQAALLLGVSLAETAYDMQWLMNGKEVLVAKDSDSWHCSLLGAISNRNSDTCSHGSFRFGYKDYLRVFLLVHSVRDVDRNKLMARMADCMQFNLRKNSSTPLDLTQSYTMISINTDVSIHTTFMDMAPRLAGGTLSGDENLYQIHYKSVMAY